MSKFLVAGSPSDVLRTRQYPSTDEEARNSPPELESYSTASFRIASLPASSFHFSNQPWTPWTLYLPGICIHSVTEDNREDPLHLQSPSPRAQTLKYQPFTFYEAGKEPILLEHPLSTQETTILGFMRTEAAALPCSSAHAASAPSNLYSSSTSVETSTNGNKQAFENTSTSVAASQMRNALNNLADTVTDAEDKKVRTQQDVETWHVLIHGSFSRLRWTTSLLFSEDT